MRQCDQCQAQVRLINKYYQALTLCQTFFYRPHRHSLFLMIYKVQVSVWILTSLVVNNRKTNQPKRKRELANPHIWKPPSVAASNRNSQDSLFLFTFLSPSLLPSLPLFFSFSLSFSLFLLYLLSVDLVIRQFCLCMDLQGSQERCWRGIKSGSFWQRV